MRQCGGAIGRSAGATGQWSNSTDHAVKVQVQTLFHHLGSYEDRFNGTAVRTNGHTFFIKSPKAFLFNSLPLPAETAREIALV